MDLKIEIEKGNNEQDKNKNKADAEETSRMLLEEFFFDSDHDEEYMGNQCLWADGIEDQPRWSGIRR